MGRVLGVCGRQLGEERGKRMRLRVAEHRRPEGTEQLGLYPAGNREPVRLELRRSWSGLDIGKISHWPLTFRERSNPNSTLTRSTLAKTDVCR